MRGILGRCLDKVVFLLALMRRSAMCAAQYPAPAEGDFVISNFRFTWARPCLSFDCITVRLANRATRKES